MSVTISETSEGKRRGNPEWGWVMPYEEAREIVSKKGFKNLNEYIAWVKEEKPEGFSVNPYAIYKYRGEWVSARHFLGKIDCTTDTKVIASEDTGLTGFFPFHKIRTIINQILHPKVNV